MTVRDPTSLVCKDVVELVTEYLSEALSPEDRARLEQHLLVCPPCTAYLGQVKTTIGLTAELRDEPAMGVDAALTDLFRRRRPP